MAKRVLFVAGSHTEIGKTHVACGLLRAAIEEGWRVDALKPVVSGFDPHDWVESDPARLMAAMGRPLTDQELEMVAPWRYRVPVAPPMAAALEGAKLDFATVVSFCRRRIADSDADLMVVEGVGGLMSPIAPGATSLDLLESLEGRSVLVGGAYLGALSHTLTALEVMHVRGVAPGAVVLSESSDPDAPDFAASLELLSELAGRTSTISASRDSGYAWAGPVLRAVFG